MVSEVVNGAEGADPVTVNQLVSSLRRPRAAGRFIALMGTDGAGKSTQAKLLSRRLNQSGCYTYVAEVKDDLAWHILHSWGGAAGNGLSHEELGIVLAVEAMKDFARTSLPLLTAGINVIAPRSIFCQMGMARVQCGPRTDRIESLLTFYGEPDLTIFLDVTVETTMERIEQRAFDDEDPELMKSFGHELRIIARERGLVAIDGNRPRAEVHADVWRLYQGQFGDLVDQA